MGLYNGVENLPVNNMHIVEVGNKKTVLPKLQSLQYEVAEVDTDGNSFGSSSLKQHFLIIL